MEAKTIQERDKEVLRKLADARDQIRDTHNYSANWRLIGDISFAIGYFEARLGVYLDET